MVIFQSVYLAQHTMHRVYHGVDELRLKLFKYSNFYYGDAQQDLPECLLLLTYIMDNAFLPYSTDEYRVSSYRDFLSELVFSFVFENILSAMYAD